MAQSQSRKKVLEGVQRQRRRQRTVTLTILGIVLAVIIAGGAYVFSQQKASGLPAYLDKCINTAPFYHSHPHLTIMIRGSPQVIPGDVGRSGGCNRPLHTHATDGIIHVEPDEDRTFTVHDFFLIWGQPFNSTQILFQKASPGQITMTVNDQPEPRLGGYPLPRNASTGQGGCSILQNGTEVTPPGGCVPYDIVISYSSGLPTS